MAFESVKEYLEKGVKTSSEVDELPSRFLEPVIMNSLTLDHVEHGRVVCSMKIPSRLLNYANTLHGGATASLVDVMGSAAICSVGRSPLNTGISLEISVTYLGAAFVDEEIEIEAKALRVGKAVAVISIEFRNKKTGKNFAQGRNTKYLAVTSKI